MPRIPIIDRADMNAEQGRVYDAAKQSSGIVGGPYYAYIRLPKLFEACQNLRDSLSSGPLSQREQQIVTCLANGTRTINEMLPTMYVGLPAFLLPAAARSVFAHLLHMLEQERVHCEGDASLHATYFLR